MMKLFAAVLGGRTEGCNIELHDVVFAVSESIENAYPTFRKKWFGTQKRLHLDSYIELNCVDGYEVTLSKEQPQQNSNKLFFVNFGMYKEGYFGEYHETNFYVDTNKAHVLQRAKKDLCIDGIQPHCDDNIVVDDIIDIAHIDHYYLHFKPTTQQKKIKVNSAYCRLDT